jgi:peptidoglycan hydrolase CwlO-like protein
MRVEELRHEVSASNNNDSTDRLQQELNEVRDSIPYDIQNNLDNLTTQVQELTATLDNNEYLNDLAIQSLEFEISYLKERINELNSP